MWQTNLDTAAGLEESARWEVDAQAREAILAEAGNQRLIAEALRNMRI